MKRKLALVLCALMLIAVAACAKPLDEQGLIKQAQQTISQLEAGEIATVYAQFDASLKKTFTEQTLGQQWQGLHQTTGAFRAFGKAKVEQSSNYVRVIQRVTYEFNTLDIAVITATSGQIAGLNVSIATGVDDGAALPEGLVEEPVTVQTGEFQLPGTLTLPQSGEALAAVVIVHGSGPSDRNGSLNNLRPYRDIAWTLAKYGIAVLRYDKRTLVYQQQVAQNYTLTVNEETVEDAVSAVNLLRNHPRIDGNKIFVLGHSLGGMLLPRIQQGANARGLIFLAAAASQIEDAILRQSEYIAQLSVADGTITAEQAEAQLSTLRVQVRNIKELKSDSNLAPSVLLGVPKSYWLDLHAYDPVAAAEQLKVPMLLLQGERDYQVTMDDFARWQSLTKGANRRYKTFPTLGHMMTLGNLPPSPKDYLVPYTRMDGAVLDAIALFIKDN